MLGKSLNGVKAASEFSRPTAGGYIIQIKKVRNNVQKSRLEIDFDFYEGEFKDYYTKLKERAGFWGGTFTKSYSDKALAFLKAFIEAVQASNENTEGLVIGDFDDIDETKLVGLLVGMAIGEKEYMGNDGQLKTRLDAYNARFYAINDIVKGNYIIPEFRSYTGDLGPSRASDVIEYVDATETTNSIDANFGPVNDADIPF